MKYSLASICFFLLLTSGSVAAQGTPQQTETVREVTDKRPLIVLRDGVEHYKLANERLQEIDPEWIEEVQVLKDGSATENFGAGGKDGVVIIAFKSDVEAANQYLEKVREKNDKVKSPVPAGIFRD